MGFKFAYRPREFNIGGATFAFGVLEDDIGLSLVVAEKQGDGTFLTWGGEADTTGWIAEYYNLIDGFGKSGADKLVEQHGSLRNALAWAADEAYKRAEKRVASPPVNPSDRISRMTYHAVVSVSVDPATQHLSVPPAPLTP